VNVVSYSRVSSDKQDIDLSISAQLRALREYAAKNGHKMVREFVDTAESGRTADRPAFREMIALSKLRNRPFDGILVWKLSRFARNREDSIIYKSLLRKQGIQVVSINEPIEDSPSGRLLEGIIEVIDEFYSANLAQDVTRGMREAAARGYFCGGYVPYGYRVIKVQDAQATRSKLELNDATAPVVRRIYRESLTNGVKEIAKGLNRDGVPSPRGKEWSVTGVYDVLTNEAMAGTLVWGRKRKGKEGFPLRVESAWPAIVDKDTFASIQAVLASRSPRVTRPRCATSEYMLSGMIRCAECDAPLRGHAAKSRRFFYYRCGSALRRGPEACPGKWLPKERIEQFVVNRIRDCILTEENLAELVRLTNEEMAALTDGEAERVRMLESQIEDVESRLERLYDALERGKFGDSELAPRIRTLVATRDELYCAREHAQDSVKAGKIETEDIEVMRDYVSDLGQLLGSSTVMEQKAFLKTFVDCISVSRSELTIKYTLPMPPSDVDSETMGVLAFVRSGRPACGRTTPSAARRSPSGAPGAPPDLRPRSRC